MKDGPQCGPYCWVYLKMLCSSKPRHSERTREESIQLLDRTIADGFLTEYRSE
jgi:hypothetical protein